MQKIQNWEEVTATYARDNFAELINNVVYQKRRFVISKQGKPAAFILPPFQTVPKTTIKVTGHQFLLNLSHYGLKKAPRDLAQNHDKYTW